MAAKSPPTNRGWRIGLTGGMGCGKSTATEIMRELGFGVVNSDAIVRELWETDESLMQAVTARWGKRVLDSGAKTIARRKVAEIVFANPAELDWLEAQVLPKVRARWQAVIAAEPRRDWVAEIPLLFEKNLASEFDFTLCIASSTPVQMARLAARGLPSAEIAARQARQWPLSQKMEQADWVALNDGSRDFLRRQLVEFAAQLHPAH